MRATTSQSFKLASRRIAKFTALMHKDVGKATRQIADEIHADCASRPGKGVPRDTGNLAATGKVRGPDARSRSTISYGGTAAPYAMAQHERLDYHHDLGEARWLIRAVERWEPGGSQAMRALAANAEAGIRLARAGAA